MSGRPGFNPWSSHTKDSKWYLMSLSLTLSMIRYGSRVKWVNPGKGVTPSCAPWYGSYQKGSLLVTLDYGCQLYLLRPCQRAIKAEKWKGEGDTNLSSCAWNSPWGFGKALNNLQRLICHKVDWRIEAQGKKIEVILTKVLLRIVRISRRVLETKRHLFSL